MTQNTLDSIGRFLRRYLDGLEVNTDRDVLVAHIQSLHREVLRLRLHIGKEALADLDRPRDREVDG